jgi:serine/threonine protein kinase
MDERTTAAAVPEGRPGDRPDQAAPVGSPEVTGPYVPSNQAEDASAGQMPASEPPAGEAEEPDGIPDQSLSFLRPGTQPGSLGRLGHYEVLALLGKGAFGIVFKALDEKLQRLVAIKVLGPQLVRNPTARSRFLREARAAAAVNSKHVVSTYEVYEQPIPYLVMEYVAGKSLQERIDQTGALETRDIFRIGGDIAEGLAAAHLQGLIHRDIKPANILLEVGRGKITDFGLARAVDDASLTRSGMIVGTPQFMSPEQARGEALDSRSDLFSLGSVLYTMCTGEPPFRAPRTLGVLKRVCDDTPRPIRDSNADIPDALAAIVSGLLVKDPAGRFQSAAEVADLLKQHLAHLDDPSPPRPSRMLSGAETTDDLATVSVRSGAASSAKKGTRSRWKWAGAATGVLLIVLTLTLTETVGITHLFGGGGALTDPNKLGSEPTSLRANDAPAEKQRSPKREKPIKKKAVAIAAADAENPFKKAKVGDWAEYKITHVRTSFDPEGKKMDVKKGDFEGEFKMVVTTKTETAATIKTTKAGSRREFRRAGEDDIDLTQPYDPATFLTTLFLSVDAKLEKTDRGTEKIKVGAKEYETSWTKMKIVTPMKPSGPVEGHLIYWMARSGPLGGLVRMEITSVSNILGARMEDKLTMEVSH